MTDTTREPQYKACIDIERKIGLTRLGLMSNQTWHDDPKRLLFHLSRYKFVAKMLSGKQRVLEVGCADAFGTRIVQQEVSEVVAVDFDPVFIHDVQNRMVNDWKLDCRIHDMLDGPVEEKSFDAAFALDVLEHIPEELENIFLEHMTTSLNDDDGVMIIGMPSLQSQQYASPISQEGHVNCKDRQGFYSTMSRFFKNVFIFSMNDEVIHTGFSPMAHYLLALCCTKR